MKKKLFSSYFLALVSLVSLQTRAGEITVNFSGTLRLPACQIIVEEPNKLFALGRYTKRELSKITRTPGTPFYIDIQSCEGNKKISISFKGNESPNSPGALAIQGEASGAAVGIESDAGLPIRVNTDNLIYELTNSEGNSPKNRLSFRAYLIPNIGNTLTPGFFNTSVNFELSYP